MKAARAAAFALLVLAPAATGVYGQSARLRTAGKVALPAPIDGNSPAFWTEEGFNLYSSTGDPEMINIAPGQFGPWKSQRVNIGQDNHVPWWIESAWRDSDGTVFGWYHHEPGGMCGGNGLTAPKIGAVVSFDGGKTVKDLGIILESGDAADCSSKNGFFAGGHGDLSVVLDGGGEYFYFFFTNYGGPESGQGIVTARLAFEDRYHPGGAVRKFYRGEWLEPGIGGRVTAIFPAKKNWQREDTDSFWGPAVHWNTYLQKFVMLLNHACCAPGWPQEGIYAAFTSDPRNPAQWKAPVRILEGGSISQRPAFYPQVIGLGEGETDSLAGEVARLYVQGVSNWEIVFYRDEIYGVNEPDDPQRDVDENAAPVMPEQ